MKYSKYSMITLRVTDEEKGILENQSFMSGLSISDILREGLKLYFKDTQAFETTNERRNSLWRL